MSKVCLKPTADKNSKNDANCYTQWHIFLVYFWNTSGKF